MRNDHPSLGSARSEVRKAGRETDPNPTPATLCGLFVNFRRQSARSRRSRNAAGFTLAEAMIAVGVTGIFVAGCVWAIISDQVCLRKAKEEAIGMNFLTKYVETLKALPFSSVAPGLPINYYFDGSGGAPLITIPATNSWVPVNTTAFETFYPDLLWLTNRNPAMQVSLTQNSVGGSVHDIEINVRFDWDPPLGEGGRLEVVVDCLRTVDVPTL